MDWTTHWTKSLPIDARIGEVLEALAAAQVVVCEASTGSGKTTRLAQAAVIADPNLRVWVTQPRRAAVRWIATHIAKEMGVQLGTLVGYSLRRDDSGVATKSSETRLEFLVDKSLINRIRSRGMLPGLIVVDEAHERSIDIDLLLGLLKDALLTKLSALPDGQRLFLKLTLPEQDDFYVECVKHRAVARVLALSGGYSRQEGNERLRRHHGIIASFSRGLLEGLTAQQSDAEFNSMLDAAIQSIFEASKVKIDATKK